jgi:hypothetical protein
LAYRYTNTDKWGDAWFSSLKPMEKLLFTYLCDNCDIAGFIELNTEVWASFIKTDKRAIEGALKGLARGLIYSKSGDCIYLRTFLKHQKNLPLNPERNQAHKGIMKRFDLYKYKFEIITVFEFIEGACKGLGSPYGNGNGNGIGNGIKGGEGGKVATYKILFEKIVSENNIELPNGFDFLILEWLKYKSEKGQAYKDSGMLSLIKKFLKDSGGSVKVGREMLDYSMSKNYAGLFKEKDNIKNKQPEAVAAEFGTPGIDLKTIR